MKYTNLKKSSLFCVLATTLISGCGGGGDGSDAGSDSSNQHDSDTSINVPADLPAITTPDLSLPTLSLPTTVANGSTVELLCGRVYRGTLNLANKSGVTVRTNGECGKATLTPGEPITGWTRHQGNIWVAPISFNAAQVLINGQPLEKAHWPSKAQTWATASSSNANSLAYSMPNSDLTDATVVFKPYDWSIEARRITGYAGNTISFASTGKQAFDDRPPSGSVKFYVEGKLWMLDEANEWAVSNGKLYVWTADGASPEGRAWASPDAHGINAANSSNVAINGVRIYGSADGINAQGATNLKVSNAEIINSSENGILNTGGSGLAVDKTGIRNSRHNAIFVRWGGGNESITDSKLDSSGVLGMPTNSHGAITLTLASGATVQNNTITNSGYIGVRVSRNSSVTGNTIDASCQVLSDCGGVYTSSPDQAALNTRIEKNTIRNTSPSQRLSWGVQLDAANGVTVSGNIFSGNSNGVILFDSYNNAITDNSFSQSGFSHVVMAESISGRIRNNTVSGNRFVTSSSNGETYRVSSDFGASPVTQFSSYSNNSYQNSASIFANFNGELISFSQWKSRTGQDTTSSYSTP
jgi:parallel beta-helix repeat protein